MGDEHPLWVEVEQRLQRRDEALAVPARALLAVEVILPDPQPIAGLDHRVAEGERLVRGDPERLLLTTRAADRVGADAGGKLGLGRDRVEAGALGEAARTGLVSPDRAALPCFLRRRSASRTWYGIVISTAIPSSPPWASTNSWTPAGSAGSNGSISNSSASVFTANRQPRPRTRTGATRVTRRPAPDALVEQFEVVVRVSLTSPT